MSRKSLVLVSIMALAVAVSLLGAPSLSRADTIVIRDISVNVGGAVWCGSASGTCAGNNIWSTGITPAGITLLFGQSLILTQTGGNNNFDSSERGGGASGVVGSGVACNSANGTPCVTTLTINGVAVTLSGADQDNLADRNADPLNATHNEAHDWGTSVGKVPGFGGFGDVYFGYADNLHSNACADSPTICLPNSSTGGSSPSNLFDGTFGSTRSTFFIGQGSLVGKSGIPTQNPSNECVLTDASSLCYDAGAILIYNTQPVPEPVTMFLGGTGLILLGYAARRRLFAAR
jgi:hypothetical protein